MPATLGPSTVLGTTAIPLIQLTGAYATFANLGKRNPPRAILAIEDSTGTVEWTAGKAPNTQVISPQASYMLTNVLIDNPARAPDLSLYNPLTLDAAVQHHATGGQRRAPRRATSGRATS